MPGPAENPARSVVIARRLATVLAIATVAVFARSLPYAFVDWDDQQFVYRNADVLRGLTWSGVIYAFKIHAPSYHPLAFLSHMLDVSLFGLNPIGHRLHNIVEHAASVWLLMLLLHRLTGSVWRAFVVSAVFALHPLRVESVVWISERKDVSCMLLMLLTLHAYVSFVRARGVLRRRWWYVAVVVLYALSLLAKPMAVTLPGVMLLLDYWPLRRWRADESKGGELAAPDRQPTDAPVSLWRLIAEKVPLMALSAVSSWLTYLCQDAGGAVVTSDRFSHSVRILNVFASVAAYFGKFIWPAKLAVVYPMRRLTEWPVALLGVAMLIAITAIALHQWRRRPAIAVGWFWYLGTLVPVVGIVQVGGQAMADRYTYLPMIGPTLAIVWLLAEAMNRRAVSMASRAAIFSIVIVALTAATLRQIPHWRDSESLFRRAIDVSPFNPLMHYGLGVTLLAQKRTAEAVESFQQAAEDDPSMAEYPNNLGAALLELGRLPEAEAALRRSLAINPNYTEARVNLGWAMLMAGDQAGAIDAFQTALTKRPDAIAARRGLAVAYNNAGIELARAGRMGDAAAKFELALAADPANASAAANLARARQAAATQPAAPR